MIVAIAFSKISVPWLLIPIIIYSAIESYGAYFIQSGFHFKSLCKAKTNEKNIVITFDDGPSANAKEVLEKLKRANVKATFFLIGKNILNDKEVVKQIHDEGHLIGNHSFTHSGWFDLFSANRIKSELIQTEMLIQETTGITTKLFRPPFGVTNPNLRKALTKLNLISIGWNVRSFDTSIKDEKKN